LGAGSPGARLTLVNIGGNAAPAGEKAAAGDAPVDGMDATGAAPCGVARTGETLAGDIAATGAAPCGAATTGEATEGQIAIRENWMLFNCEVISSYNYRTWGPRCG
jgi:hypothetical protein